MKMLVAVTAMVAVLALPACAQRGGGHGGGGFSGHGASVGHAGVSGGMRSGGGSRPGGFSGSGVHAVNGRFYARPGYAGRAYAGQGYAGFPPRAGYLNNRGPRLPYRPPYRGGHGLGVYGVGGYPYGYPYVNPYLLGYPDAFDDEGYDNGYDAAPYADYGQQGYADDGQGPDSPYGPGYGPGSTPGYGGAPAPYPNQGMQPGQGYGPGYGSRSGRVPYTGSGVTSHPANETAVTVIFKDGRPAEQIHNYMLTSSTLTVLDGRYRQIPLDEIDREATVAMNRAEGVDFTFPNGGQ